MDQFTTKAPATFESVWATLDRIGETMKESSARFDREMAASRAEAERRAAEAVQRAAEADRRAAETEKEIKAMRESIRQVNKELGGVGNSNGYYAEDFFYNALLHGQRNLFGEFFDEVTQRNKVAVNKGFEDEYDILLLNGRAVCVVEVKYKVDDGDLAQKVLRKAETFRVNFPQHKEKKIYLAVAGMSFHPFTEKTCSDNGIAIMKQLGDTVVINDAHVKVF